MHLNLVDQTIQEPQQNDAVIVEFIKAINNNDIQKIQKSHLDWKQEKLWSVFNTKTPKYKSYKLDCNKISKLTLWYLYNDLIPNDFPESFIDKKYNAQLALQNGIVDAFLLYARENTDLLNIEIIDFIYTKDIEKATNSFLYHIFNRGNLDLSISNLDKYHQWIFSNISDDEIFKFFQSFQKNTNYKNIDFFLNHPKYFAIIEKNIKINPDVQENMMNDAIKHGIIPMIKILQSLGIKLTHHKQSYSELFSSSQKIQASQFIVNELADLSMHNHLILKTILHKDERENYNKDAAQNRLELVQNILSKYNENQIFDIENILLKRKDSPCIEYIKKFINLKKLELTVLTNLEGSSATLKKLKI